MGEGQWGREESAYFPIVFSRWTGAEEVYCFPDKFIEIIRCTLTFANGGVFDVILQRDRI